MSAPAAAAPGAPAAAGATAAPNPDIPSEKVLFHAAKIAVEQDKPILLDYYRDTRLGSAFLGEDRDSKERILVKNPEEFTSPVQKMFKALGDFIIMTENSIYIVHGNIKKKEISSAGM